MKAEGEETGNLKLDAAASARPWLGRRVVSLGAAAGWEDGAAGVVEEAPRRSLDDGWFHLRLDDGRTVLAHTREFRAPSLPMGLDADVKALESMVDLLAVAKKLRAQDIYCPECLWSGKDEGGDRVCEQCEEDEPAGNEHGQTCPACGHEVWWLCKCPECGGGCFWTYGELTEWVSAQLAATANTEGTK